MTLRITDPEVKRLAQDVARLAGESETEAVRRSLIERRDKLLLAQDGRSRSERMLDVLEQRIWPMLREGVRGTTVTPDDEDELLGYGPSGV